MKERLELKHLAPYLPYGLKINTPVGIDVPKGGHIYTMQGVSYKIKNGSPKDLFFEVEEKYGKEMSQSYNLFKPILRPLSDLTKEIEHSGEKFVPIERIDEIFGDSETYYVFVDGIFTENNFHSVLNNGVSYKMPNVKCYPFFIVEKLFKWHFDFFSLIDKNIAINKNTLQNLK